MAGPRLGDKGKGDNMDDLYKRADILYSDKNEKIIFLFDSFIKKIREKNFSSVRNKDLDSLRIVHEHLESVDFSMRKEIDVARRFRATITSTGTSCSCAGAI